MCSRVNVIKISAKKSNLISKENTARHLDQLIRKLIKKVLGDAQPMTERFAETIAPEFEQAKAELGSRAESALDVLSYICFPQQAEQYFDQRDLKRALVVSYSIEEVK